MRVVGKEGHLYELNENIYNKQEIDDNIMAFKNTMKDYFAETESNIIKISKDVQEMKIICIKILKWVNGGYFPKVCFDTEVNKICI